MDGFVLVGGQSSRMGRDKAHLPYRGGTLASHVAAAVQQACGSVTLVGDPRLYRDLGYPVAPDEAEGCGPLAGIVTALGAARDEWTLVAACDMPGITPEFLAALMAQASGDAVLPAGESGFPEPLCALYHRRCLPVLRTALAGGVRKITHALAGLDVRTWSVSAHFYNLNTPEDWAAHAGK